jgi:hypothetical protein
VQYGGGKELATLPHLTPGFVRLAVVVWGVLCMGMCVRVCVYAHLVPALYEDPTSLRADNCTYVRTYIHTYIHAYTHTYGSLATRQDRQDGRIENEVTGEVRVTWTLLISLLCSTDRFRKSLFSISRVHLDA